MNQVQISKFLSLVLRHEPNKIGITLDENGWVEVEEFIDKLQAHGHPISRKELEQIVAENDKKRFAFSLDRMKIRASQGHSVQVNLDLPISQPPDTLYHGTPIHVVNMIKHEGLTKQSRTHVHLSSNTATAMRVGQRRGKAVILEIKAGEMAKQGHHFYVSENGVWLVDKVPVEFIIFPKLEVQV